MTLRVAFDATSLLEAQTGVGTMASSYLEGLARRSELEMVAFAVSLRGRGALKDVVPQGVSVAERTIPARVAREAWLRADLPTVRAFTGQVDLVHGPNFVAPPGGKAAELITVHDLTAVHFPKMCTSDVLQWPTLLRRAARRGAWVHAVSNFVAAEINEAFPELDGRVVAIPNGTVPPPAPSPDSDSGAGMRLAGGERYILAIGTLEPRKDFPSLVRAFDALAAEDRELRLVMAGSDGMAADEVEESIDAAFHRDRIVRLGRVDEAQRWALYRGACVVAYPSRYEGFGLVPLEAMAAGTPVVSTRVGAITEVVGDAGVLVEPNNSDALAEGLGEVLGDERLAESLVAAGSVRVARYQWSSAVEAMAQLYCRAVDAPG